ncbi:hypothetical protein [Caballeronia sp. LZ034LL]|uniref:hypothetical protein n=1 Tax=Caballeronia sp. LZ034LL TaxID=3038567 RepID=UPI00285E496D|nr:hypothetical protein [Caballeronia sp. LZ034LL]MDR5837937.1 hypothetical protein [Caballeronia sp. LZ034LL]
MLVSEANVLRNRRPSGHSPAASAWIVEHGEEDADEPVAAAASEKPEAALAGMLERLLVPTVMQIAGGVFQHAFVANCALEQLAEIRKSDAPWDQQLLQTARLATSFEEWLPSSVRPGIKGMTQRLEDAMHLWQAFRRVLASLQALDDPRRPWLQRAEDCIGVLDRDADWLPSNVQRTLGPLRRVVQYGKAIQELRCLLQTTSDEVLLEAGGSRLGLDAVLDELAAQLPPVLASRLEARREGRDALTFCRTETERACLAYQQVSQSGTWEETFAAVGGWLGNDASDDGDALATIRQQLDAFRSAYDDVCALLSGSANFELRLLRLADYLQSVNDSVSRTFLAERLHPAIDALTGLLRTSAAASSFYQAFLAIYRNDSPWQGKLQNLRDLMEQFASAGLADCPASVQDVFGQMTSVMHILAELSSLGQASGAREVIGRVASVVNRLEALLPALEASLPDGAMARVDGIFRTVEWLTRQIQTLSELPEDATLADYLTRLFQEGDAPSWLPTFMQPLSAFGHQLGEALQAYEDAQCPAFPRSGPLSEQLNWVIAALQSDKLTDATVKLLPASLAPTVRLSRGLLMRVNAFPVEASAVERASWLLTELSGPDVRALLNDHGGSQSGVLGEYIADEDFHKWLDLLHHLMKGRLEAGWSGGLMAAMLEHWRTIGSALCSVALRYVPGGLFIKQVRSWVHRVRPQEDWMATADDFIRIVASDIREDVSSGRFAMLQLFPGATAEGLDHAAKAIRHFTLDSEQWDWNALTQEYARDSAQQVLFDALLLVRLTWSLHRLATSDPLIRDATLQSLQRDVEHLRLLGWRGMTSLEHLLPLVPDLWALRGRINLESAKTSNWFEWAAAVCGALARYDTPAIQRFKQKLEEQTEALLANALQQTLASLSGGLFAEHIADSPDEMRLSVIPPQLAQRCAVAEEEDQEGFVVSEERRYVRDDGRLYLVRWDSDERAWSVVTGDRLNDRATGLPLERIMGRWWVRPRFAKLPGGGLFSWISTTPTASPTAVSFSTEAPGAILAVNAHDSDSPDAFVSNNLEYWTEEGEVRLRDFVIISGEKEQSSGRVKWAVGLTGAFLLFLTSVYVWRAFRRGAVPQPTLRANDSSASTKAEGEALVMEGAQAFEMVEMVEIVDSQTTVDIEQPMPGVESNVEGVPDTSAVAEPVREERAAWRPSRGEMAALAVLGGASLGMMGWASFNAWQGRRSQALVTAVDLDAAREVTRREFEIVVDAPFDTHASESAGRERRSANGARGASAIGQWPLPRNAEIDTALSAEVALRFDPRDSYKPRRGDFGASHLGGVYWDSPGAKAYLFVADRYWRFIYWRKKGEYHRAWIEPENERNTSLDIKKRDDGMWSLVDATTATQAPVVQPATSSIDEKALVAIKAWDAEKSFKYAEQAAGIEGRVYTNWDGAYLYASGNYWPAVVIHENLIRVLQEKRTGAQVLYLRRQEPGSPWKLARVVKPESLPVRIAVSPDLAARAKAVLTGEPWTSAWTPDELPCMFRKSGSEAKYLRIDDTLYRCSEVDTKCVSHFPERLLTLVWRLEADAATMAAVPLLAGQDTSGAWQSILSDRDGRYWIEERVRSSRALERHVASLPVMSGTPEIWQLAPVSPGLYATVNWMRYLRVGGRLYPCVKRNLDPRAFANQAPETVMDVQGAYAGYVSGRGWALFRTGASGKLELVQVEDDTATGFGALPSVSSELAQRVETFDTAHALRYDSAGMGHAGVIYAEDGQLSISVNGRYWLFTLLSPHMGIIFGDSSGQASCVVTISDGQWQAYGGSATSLGLQDVLAIGMYHGFGATLEAAVGSDAPTTWSQTIELLDNAADNAFHGSYQKPASHEFSQALSLKFQVAYLKSISDSSGKLRKTLPAPDMSELNKKWDAETIKRYWPLFQPDQESLTDPDFTEVCALRGVTPLQVGQQAEKLKVLRADLVDRKALADTNVETSKREYDNAVTLDAASVTPIQALLTSNTVNNAKLTWEYWKGEQARLKVLQDEVEKLVRDQDVLVDLYFENPFVEGVAVGFERERAALEALKRQAPTGSHWRYGLTYTDLIAKLTAEMFREFSRDSESGKLQVIDAARLYLQQQCASLDEYAALIGRLSSVSPKQRSLAWRGDYRDTIAAQDLAVILVDSCMNAVNDEERAEGVRVITATLYHLAKTGSDPLSIDVVSLETILDEFETEARKLNPLRTPERPKNFLSLSQFKPTTLTDGDTAFYQQFVEYETSGSIDYEAAWISNFMLVKLPLTIDDFYEIKQSYFVDNTVLGRSDILIKLNSGQWLVAYCYRGGLIDPRSNVYLYTDDEMRLIQYWQKLPSISDGYRCSATWSGTNLVFEKPVYTLKHESTVPLNATKELAQELARLGRQHLVLVKKELKAALYGPAWWQLFANLVPFWEMGYGSWVDPEYEVSATQVILDVVSVLFVVIPGGAALLRAGAKAGIGMIIMQGLRHGLKGRALLNYVALQVSKLLPAFMRTGFLLMTRMLLEIISPIPLPTRSSSFRVKPVKLGNVAGSGDTAFVRSPSAIIPTEANRLAFTPLNDAFQMSPVQRPSGVYMPTDLRGNHFLPPGAPSPSGNRLMLEFEPSPLGTRFLPQAEAGPSSAALAPSSDLGLSLVRENIDQAKPWKYVLKIDRKSYGLVFDQQSNQFRLVYPDDWSQPGPLVYYTAEGWRQAPMLGAARAASESKAILQKDPGLSLVRARVLRGQVRAGRKSGRESLTVALKVLHDPEARPSVDKLLDMFMGQHSPALKSELDMKMQGSLVALRRLRSSKDVFYKVTYPGDSKARMSVPRGGENFEPPQVLSTSWYGRTTMSPADNFGGRKPYMMTVYAGGAQEMQDLAHQAYPQAFARTMIHETYHMVNKSVIDMYPSMTHRGYHVEALVGNATGFMKTSDAAGNVVNLPINDLVRLPEYDGAVKFSLPFLLENYKPYEYQYMFIKPNGHVNVDDLVGVFRNKSELGDVLRHARDNISPAMKENPDSYSFVVEGLEKIRKRPNDIKKFFDDYDQILKDGPTDESELIWPY